ncbi:MAG TPA: 6,7-dimethyl-8-ribityllumazine synthase [Vicinamibacterales bacterium]|nr:6,7-dimethyl-8-ribityllumazine synthase [Vicinamibacterales bacterium]
MRGLRFALVVSRYNDFVTDRLRDAAIETLVEGGVSREDISTHAVPGAYEIPQAAAAVAASLRPDALVCLGCVIRGATPHFEYIASAVAHGITEAALRSGVPMAFGVLTTNSVEEALERSAPGPANKGREAALAALEMARLFRGLPPKDAAE